MLRTTTASLSILGVFGASVAILTASPAAARVKAADVTVLAKDRILSPAVQPLYVTSPAAVAGQPIPDVYTAFGKNTSPPISWDGAPPNTLAYVVIMEDSDAGSPTPKLHWVAYNIPGAAKGLSHAIRNAAEPKVFSGMRQGVNDFGGMGYIGPHPDVGDPPHHYHFEVFALDRPLSIKGGLSLNKVIAAMNERVIAEGEVVGTFAAPPGPPPTR